MQAAAVGALLAALNISLGVFYAVLPWPFIVLWFAILLALITLFVVVEISKYNLYTRRQLATDCNASLASQNSRL